MSDEAERLNGFAAPQEAIRTVPVPGAPPAMSREGAAVGLAFLDMALRQNHIRRLTERLHLVEHCSAVRTTEVDIRLSLLDQRQRDATQLFQRLTSVSRVSDTRMILSAVGRRSRTLTVPRKVRRVTGIRQVS